MGAQFSQVQSPQSSQPTGKGGQPAPAPTATPAPQPIQQNNIQPQGKGGRITFPGQSGQPQMGQPNAYSNTVGPWDNASIMSSNQQAVQPWSQSDIKPQTRSAGKGKMGY